MGKDVQLLQTGWYLGRDERLIARESLGWMLSQVEAGPYLVGLFYMV